MRLIDADALINSTDSECVHKYEIALAPTGDAVAVVRCKDCKYWHEDVANFIASSTSFPRGACKVVRGITNGEFFCADGERRSE